MDPTPRLLATCWTTAGDAAPQVGDETSPLDLGERMRTAAAAGWDGFGLVHADLVAARRTHGLEAIRAIADDAGIGRIELEFLGDWWTDGAARAASDAVRRDLLDAAPVLGVDTVKIAVAMDIAPPDELFLEELDRLATEARERGVRLAIEPMPFSTNVPTLADGVRILDELGGDTVGLCVDIWHLYRAGTDYRDIPDLLDARRILVVELDDGAAEPEGTLWQDTVDRRRYPGEGAFDVPAFIRSVQRAGFDGHWGVEIISAEHRARPIDQSLPRLREAVLACFDAARETEAAR